MKVATDSLAHQLSLENTAKPSSTGDAAATYVHVPLSTSLLPRWLAFEICHVAHACCQTNGISSPSEV